MQSIPAFEALHPLVVHFPIAVFLIAITPLDLDLTHGPMLEILQHRMG